MRTYYVQFDSTGSIMRRGSCSEKSLAVKRRNLPAGQYIMPGNGEEDDRTQKVVFELVSGRPVNPRVVDKTPDELPKPTPQPKEEDTLMEISKGQWQATLDRIAAIESRLEI